MQITTVDELTKGMYALTDAHRRRYYDTTRVFRSKSYSVAARGEPWKPGPTAVDHPPGLDHRGPEQQARSGTRYRCVIAIPTDPSAPRSSL